MCVCACPRPPSHARSAFQRCAVTFGSNTTKKVKGDYKEHTPFPSVLTTCSAAAAAAAAAAGDDDEDDDGDVCSHTLEPLQHAAPLRTSAAAGVGALAATACGE